ncbi:MAG: gliding motility-associated ABC transporter ATP-binding subunit GldA [Bacteroidales bacterium]|nr:gliding motility-associated ABC transporter ATP-binding subunit GldA [Bacteroidales bacterium]
MSIIAKEITKIYGKQKALDAVSLEINAGEVVGLLGPNGAGKSTLMKIISCFLPPTSGEASVDGYDIFEQALEVKKRVGYLPEHNPLYLDMYVREYLSFLAGIHKLGKKKKSRINEIIDLTGLGLEQNKKIGALSRGYRQRVGLAQALLHDPSVLILDEPTSGLDPNQLLEIRSLIQEVGREKTILLSTHIMQEVEAICDRAVIIHLGRIVADDSTENLSKRTVGKDIITIEFSGEVDEEKLKNIKGLIRAGKIDENSWEIEASQEKDIREELFKFAVNNNISVLSLKREQQSLEEVFQALTKTNGNNE